MSKIYFDPSSAKYKLSNGALFCISLINEYNNTTVKRFTVTDKKVDLFINITEVKFFHNMFTFYGDYFSLQFIRNLIIDQVKEHDEPYKDLHYYIKQDDKLIENPEKLKEYDVRVTGSGYVTHSVVHF